MRPVRSLGRLLARGDVLLAVALLAVVVVVSPPTDPGLQEVVSMVVAVAVAVATLHLLRFVVGPARARRMGSWGRASAALGASASVLMIAGAAAAVLG